ncbi:MAG: hypothetical protein HC796_09160, partial [Synechococcaceae cyanobacterium RL_1_2]|nr:hypothetical protein [Synechococcaceae cyanobacterium RL_1_2]
RLLPSVASALEPLWNEGIEKGNPVEHLNENADTTAEVILSVTDARIEQSTNKIIKTSYKQVRKSVKPEIAASIPGLSEILSQHIKF